MNGVEEKKMATTKTTRQTQPIPRPRTEQEILAEIYKLTEGLEQRDARSLLRCAIQEIRDRRSGKDAF